MPTTDERHAIAFLVTVAVLGAGVRVVQAHNASSALQEMLRAPLDSAHKDSSGAHGNNHVRQVPLAGPSSRAAPEFAHQPSAVTATPAARARLALAAQQRRADSAHRATPPKVKKLGPGAAPIAINVAGVLELQQLPRVGPALAARIVANRDSLGPFASLQDLTRVRGIGSAMAERLSPFVVFTVHGR